MEVGRNQITRIAYDAKNFYPELTNPNDVIGLEQYNKIMTTGGAYEQKNQTLAMLRSEGTLNSNLSTSSIIPFLRLVLGSITKTNITGAFQYEITPDTATEAKQFTLSESDGTNTFARIGVFKQVVISMTVGEQPTIETTFMGGGEIQSSGVIAPIYDPEQLLNLVETNNFLLSGSISGDKTVKVKSIIITLNNKVEMSNIIGDKNPRVFTKGQLEANVSIEVIKEGEDVKTLFRKNETVTLKEFVLDSKVDIASSTTNPKQTEKLQIGLDFQVTEYTEERSLDSTTTATITGNVTGNLKFTFLNREDKDY